MNQKDLLISFALRAPASPAVWFEPVMRPRPVEPPAMVEGPLPKHYPEVLAAWLEDPREPDPEFAKDLPQVLEWMQAHLKYRAELPEWEKERDRERLSQWPWAYASGVLEAKVRFFGKGVGARGKKKKASEGVLN